jgi:hypothetical protein
VNIFFGISILLSTVDAEADSSNHDDCNDQKDEPEHAARLVSLTSELVVREGIEFSLSIIELGHGGETNPEFIVSSVSILISGIEDNIVVLEEDVSDEPGIVRLLLFVVVHDGQVAFVVRITKDLTRDHKILLGHGEEPLLVAVIDVYLQV